MSDLKEYIDKNSLFELIYPIGSIYLSAAAVNPADLFGIGSWEPIQNRFLLTSGSSYSLGAIGGEATHELTIDEMPSHGHSIRSADGKNGLEGLPKGTTSGSDGNNWSFVDDCFDLTAEGSGEFFAANTGGSMAHNNMPPYIVINAWKRVS